MTDFTKPMDDDTTARVTFYAFDPDVNAYQKYEQNYPIGEVISSGLFPTYYFKNSKLGYDLSGWYYKEGSGSVSVNQTNNYVITYKVGTNGAVFYGAWTPKRNNRYAVMAYWENGENDDYTQNKDLWYFNDGVTDEMLVPDEKKYSPKGFYIERYESDRVNVEGTAILKIWFKRKITKAEVYSDGVCIFSGSGKSGTRIPYERSPYKSYYHIEKTLYTNLDEEGESGEIKGDGIWGFPEQDRRLTAVWERNDSIQGIEINGPAYTDENLQLTLSFDPQTKILTASCREGEFSYDWFLDGSFIVSYNSLGSPEARNDAVILDAAAWEALPLGSHEVMAVIQTRLTNRRYSGTITFEKKPTGYGD